MRAAVLLAGALLLGCGRDGARPPVDGCRAVHHPILYVELDPDTLLDERVRRAEVWITVGDRTVRRPVSLFGRLWVIAIDLEQLVLRPQPVEVGVSLMDGAGELIFEGRATTQVNLDACARVHIDLSPPA